MFRADHGLINLSAVLKWYELDMNALQIFLVAYAIFTAIIFFATLVTNKVVILTLGVLLAVFLCLDFGLSGRPQLVTIGGYLGMIDGLLALYLCAAGILAARLIAKTSCFRPRKTGCFGTFADHLPAPSRHSGQAPYAPSGDQHHQGHRLGRILSIEAESCSFQEPLLITHHHLLCSFSGFLSVFGEQGTKKRPNSGKLAAPRARAKPPTLPAWISVFSMPAEFI
jgi:hypothetical protein